MAGGVADMKTTLMWAVSKGEWYRACERSTEQADIRVASTISDVR
jgi:hypothetical protein